VSRVIFASVPGVSDTSEEIKIHIADLKRIAQEYLKSSSAIMLATAEDDHETFLKDRVNFEFDYALLVSKLEILIDEKTSPPVAPVAPTHHENAHVPETSGGNEDAYAAQQEVPQALQEIEDGLHVDNFILGADTAGDAIEINKQVNQIVLNDTRFLSTIPEENHHTASLENTKTLRTFDSSQVTKRIVLNEIDQLVTAQGLIGSVAPTMSLPMKHLLEVPLDEHPPEVVSTVSISQRS